MRSASLVSLFVAFCPLVALSAVSPEMTRKLDSLVYRVETSNSNGGTSIGTAIELQPGELVTSCHVVRRARKIQLRQGNEAWVAQPYVRDIEHDLCMLTAEGLRGPAVMIGKTSDLSVGQQVLAVGFSGGRQLSVSEGSIKGLHAYDGARVIQTSAAFEPGASGGGLFDTSGRLIGILTFRSVAGGDFHYAVPTEWLAHAAAPHSPEATQAFWERTGKRQPYFMQAAALEVDGNWRALLEMGRKWIAQEATNPHSWIAIGLAYLHLNQRRDAIDAFQHASWLDPAYADALRKLAPVLPSPTQLAGY